MLLFVIALAVAVVVVVGDGCCSFVILFIFNIICVTHLRYKKSNRTTTNPKRKGLKANKPYYIMHNV